MELKEKIIEKYLNKLDRLNSIIEKNSAYLTMSKSDLALWNIWYIRHRKLRYKLMEKMIEESFQSSLPSDEEIYNELIKIYHGNGDQTISKPDGRINNAVIGAQWMKQQITK